MLDAVAWRNAVRPPLTIGDTHIPPRVISIDGLSASMSDVYEEQSIGTHPDTLDDGRSGSTGFLCVCSECD